MVNSASIFQVAIPTRRWSVRRQMAYVYKEFGVKARTQSFELFKLGIGKGKILPPHYYCQGLFDPKMSKEIKKQYIGVKASHNINAKLSPKALSNNSSLLNDKIAYSLLLENSGFTVAQTQGFFHPLRQIKKIPSLKNTEDIHVFLQKTAVFPIFGKPQSGSSAIGTASVLSVSDDGGTLFLGNGRKVSMKQYTSEIATLFPKGYLFQTFVKQNTDVEKICNNAVGTVRMVTLLQESGPEVLYAIWKVPGPKAMADNGADADAIRYMVDVETGKVGASFKVEMCGMSENSLPRALREKTLPNWDKMLEMAKKGHLVTPDHGVIGWDMAIGEEGPVIIEANPGPIHTLYQVAANKPFLNPEFAPKIDAAITFSQKRLKLAESQEIEEIKRNTAERVNKAMGR